jgi:carboxylate-amine ligase
MHNFKFGIEGEYFVVDHRTEKVNETLSQPFMKSAKKKLGAHLMYELLQSQIETATAPICSSQEVRQQLTYFRSTLPELGT